MAHNHLQTIFSFIIYKSQPQHASLRLLARSCTFRRAQCDTHGSKTPLDTEPKTVPNNISFF